VNARPPGRDCSARERFRLWLAHLRKRERLRMYQLRIVGAPRCCGGHGSRCWKGPPHSSTTHPPAGHRNPAPRRPLHGDGPVPRGRALERSSCTHGCLDMRGTRHGTEGLRRAVCPGRLPKAAVALALERATSFVGAGFGMAAHAGDCDGMQGPVQRTSGQRSRHRLNRGEQAVRSELRGLSVRVDVLSYCVELR